ncbi:MAG: hypothetical protein ACM3YO_03320 [Bacteroidota bacterium]
MDRGAMGKLYAVLGQNDALTLVSLPDGSVMGVLFSTPERALEFLQFYRIPSGEVVEIATPKEYLSVAAAFLEAEVERAILDPMPDSVLRSEQFLDFRWLEQLGLLAKG